MTNISNAQRVLKNTAALYVRMIFLTGISLYTVRIVLQTLGAADYGLYGVVGGFVSVMGFFAGMLAHMSQRFFAVCLARQEWDKLRQILSANLALNACAGAVLLMLAESAGLWFVAEKLQIPAGREMAVVVAYELSLITWFAGLMTTPFQAVLIAEENMRVYSIVAILEGAAKLLVVYLLLLSEADKLMTYAALLCVVSLGIDSIYVMYCRRTYSYVRFHICRDKKIYGEIFSFSGWNLIGALATLLRNPGINVIMNLFFGPVVNAARGIAFQINGVISSFAQNFMTAVDPQIIKNYAKGENAAFQALLYSAAKMSFFLLLVLILPFAWNVDYVLGLWLGEPPKYTSLFAILVLTEALTDTLTNSLSTGVQATGKIRAYQLIVGGMSLSIFPLAYLALELWPAPVIPFLISIGMTAAMGIGRMIMIKRLCPFLSLGTYVREVLAPAVMIAALAAAWDGFLFAGAEGFFGLVINCIGSTAFLLPIIWVLGLNAKERSVIRMLIQTKFHK